MLQFAELSLRVYLAVNFYFNHLDAFRLYG